MRNAAILFLAGMCLPAFAAERVTVAQLEKTLRTAHGKPEARVAQRLSEMELTERLSTARLEYLKANVPGDKIRLALIALADTSAFLDPPAAEILPNAAPDLVTQHKLISLATDFATKTVIRLPNLSATRETLQFQNHIEVPNSEKASINVDARLLFVGSSSATVLYRDGQEVSDESGVTGARKPSQSNGLLTWGELGQLLGTVIADANGTMTWSHWEQGAAGPLAVFHYAVPLVKSHYEVKHCCVPFESGMSGFDRIPGSFDQVPAYHGEFSVDPASGAILRLVVRTELQPTYPIVRADVVVEYGPVKVGGKTYIFPVKSVSLSKSPIRRSTGVWSANSMASGIEQTAVNDNVFGNYRLFRGDTRILTGESTELDGNTTRVSPSSAQPAHPSASPGP
jgi:hypothetical protein